MSLNDYARSIPDGSYVFMSYPDAYRLSSTFYKGLPTIKLRRGILVFLIIPEPDETPFHIVSNPLDYGAAFIVEFTDREFAYLVKIVDHFGDAADSENDSSLLYPYIQDEDVEEENWDKQLAPMYKIPLSESYIIISNSGTFCHTVHSHSSPCPDAIQIREALAKFNPPLLLTSEDFNPPSVPVVGKSGAGADQSVTPEVSRTAQQNEEDIILGGGPQTTVAMKRTADADSLRPITIMCLHDQDRIDEILGGVRSVTQTNIVTLIEDLFIDHPDLQTLAAFAGKLIPKLLGFKFVIHQSGQPNSISTGDFGGLTIASFQKNLVDPNNTTHRYLQKKFERPWAVERAVGTLENVLNMITYRETDPDYSIWKLMFGPLRSQLKSDRFGAAAQEPGSKATTVIVHSINLALNKLGKAFNDKKNFNFSSNEWIVFGRSLLCYNDKDVIALSKGSDQAPPAQFSNVPVEKKAIVPTGSPKPNNKEVNPVIAANKDKRKKDDAQVESPVKDKKLRATPLHEQVCLQHFQKAVGLKTEDCTNSDGLNGKCARIHVAVPIGSAKWDSAVLDKALEGAKMFNKNSNKEVIIAKIASLR